MTMATNEQAQTPPRSHNSKRVAAIYGFAGTMLALIAVMTFSRVDAWYLVIGFGLIAVLAVVYVAKAIIALRHQND
ncbi:hypothetical protein FQ377_01290 [Arthrobacter echini]|uniref:Uncharacterized protein n=1 Tax=Arthrobacter echini TaxID=1529066 RepID=A0A5D0XUD6_9MICC|nr:hypothetical protein [Arthrobacter echini]TYD00130.1 hypothetical protein FQ377_01290 [Arthrobacter echini]